MNPQNTPLNPSVILFRYTQWVTASQDSSATNNQLRDIFEQLLLITAGDVEEALQWLTSLDQRYNLSNDRYGIGDLIAELKREGFLEDDEKRGNLVLTRKAERELRQKSLEEVFNNLKQAKNGQHKTPFIGKGDERMPESRSWKFGDDLNQLDITKTLSNTYRRTGGEGWELKEDDFEVFETDHHTSTSTVLMIDLSHSMILYGEDRITPARKTAMALSELIMTRYPKDTLDIVAFGNDAWEVSVKDLPYLQVGPFHTNTRAGLQRARMILSRRKNRNKQIIMITDGKPSCHYEFGRLYKNPYGLDRKIVNKVLDEAVMCKREGITITTFMIAKDGYLQHFIQEMTEANAGRAYFASLDNLGAFIFEDYARNRKKRGVR
ncbi:MAG: VWA domain-containing protein [Rhodothermia bacterium]|nr:VWA domain-containing protein [Rhodothermia bacterium]